MEALLATVSCSCSCDCKNSCGDSKEQRRKKKTAVAVAIIARIACKNCDSGYKMQNDSCGICSDDCCGSNLGHEVALQWRQ